MTVVILCQLSFHGFDFKLNIKRMPPLSQSEMIYNMQSYVAVKCYRKKMKLMQTSPRAGVHKVRLWLHN